MNAFTDVAIPADTERLLSMAEEFVAQKYNGVIKIDRAVSKRTIEHLRDNECFLVARLAATGEPVGFICGSSGPDVFSGAEKAVEIAWWVDRQHRGQGYGFLLLAAFVKWAEDVGAVAVCIASPPVEPEAAEHSYAKMGFRRIETYWEKRLVSDASD